MDSKSQLDLYLTEVSMELLGNKFYDINGMRQHKLIDLFKACEAKEDRNEHSVEILCSLGFEDKNENSTINFLEDQFDFILKDANDSAAVNQKIISNLKKIKSDQDELLKDASQMYVKKLVERNKILTSFNKIRQQVINECTTNNEMQFTCESFYDAEREQLIQSCMDTIRFIKYVINDPHNEAKKGELISFVHAMRTIRDCESTSKNKRNKIKKPYKKIK
ncbi:hypothetical protein PVAND_010759 [Polypedilum vanderplanki]|uniref:Uncharacterized protein n=1 Tax=Polypedilum vanderplanki TaxID=319348 RepID=A0A9J6CIA7_POLVA|nr:hypothetical protein PVAND_010759 [Polypedilum vanderplanki]